MHENFSTIYSLRKTIQDSHFSFLRVAVIGWSSTSWITTTYGVIPSSGSPVLGRLLLQRAAMLFQPHGTGARSRREVFQSRRRSRRGCDDCSILTTIFTIGVGYWIRRDLPCPQSSRELKLMQVCSCGQDDHGKGRSRGERCLTQKGEPFKAKHQAEA